MLTRLGRDPADEVIALLLGSGGPGGPRACVRFVDDHQLGALLDEDVAPDVRLDEVDADDLIGVIVVDARIALDLAVEPCLGVRANDDRLDVELRADLLLPLVAEVGQADDREALDLPALQKLADDEQSFDRLADADIIGDE